MTTKWSDHINDLVGRKILAQSIGRSYKSFAALVAGREEEPVEPGIVLDRVYLDARYSDDPVALALLDTMQELIDANASLEQMNRNQGAMIDAREQNINELNKGFTEMRSTMNRMTEERQAIDAVINGTNDNKARRRLVVEVQAALRKVKERHDKVGAWSIGARMKQDGTVEFDDIYVAEDGAQMIVSFKYDET